MRSTLLVFGLLLTPAASAYIWPVLPNDSVQPLGNNWGNYQNYGGGGYFHNGIDIITPGRQGSTVVAVAHGWIKGWGTIQGDWHWRLAISDSGMGFTGRAPGWLYAHIDPDRWHADVGDEVFPGDTIGYLVPWSVDGFDHIHFARISDTGALWNRFPEYTWRFIENPLDLIEPSADLAAPVFEDARSGRLFAFCRNNSTAYLEADSLFGEIDIISRIYDKTGYSTGNDTWDILAPYQIEHLIRRADGLVIRPWTLSLQFSNELDASLVGVVYKYDGTCRSRGDYERRAYFFIVTNTDGDSVIEAGDVSGSWNTEDVYDADYWVVVRAADHVGNTTVDSMLVSTRNGLGVTDLPPRLLSRPFCAFPNPGSGPVRISFGLGRPASVRLRLIDNAGRVAGTLADGILGPGDYRLEQTGLRPGIYFAELTLDRTDRLRAKLVIVNP